MRTGIFHPLSACSGLKPFFVFLLILLKLAILYPSLSPGQPKPQIHLQGVEGALKTNIKAQLSLFEESCDSPRWQVNEAFTHADKEIRRALRALGYYEPAVESHFEFTETCWRATFKIQPGPRVIIRQIDLRIQGEAENDPVFQAFMTKLPLQPGDPLNHGAYEALKNRLLDMANQRGYFDARFSRRELRVDLSRHQADIVLHFDSGRRYRFGQLKIQQDILDPEFINKYVNLKPDAPYEGDRLTQVYQSLAGSGYFAEVEIQPLHEQTREYRVPIQIRLFPRKRHFFKIGAGFDTNTGPRVSLGYENRYLNHHGHRLNLRLRYSPVRSEFSSQYQIPWDDPLHETLTVRSGFLHEDTDTQTSDQGSLGIQFIHPRQKWTETFGVDLRYEKSQTGDQTQESLLALPAIEWTRVHADDPLRPKQGWKLDIKVKGGVPLFGDPVIFLQARTYGKWIRQLPWRGRIITRLEAATTWVDRFPNLPTSHRYFAGGDNSIRGYGYKKLGPKDSEGEVIGGRHLAVASLEYEQLFLENWGAAIFVDAGNAFNSFQEPIKIGAGAGIRWYSPVGPIRLDLATPVDPHNLGIRLHISMGPAL